MSPRKKIKTKSKFLNWVLDWVDAILFAVVVVTLINTFWFQSFKIPSSSMESSLYTGDHLFVSKLTYGAVSDDCRLVVRCETSGSSEVLPRRHRM